MKQKITFFKVLLTLVLLCGVGNAWGESTTATLSLSSSNKFGTQSPSSLNDDQGNTWTCTSLDNDAGIQNSYQATYSGQQFGTGSTQCKFTFSASIANKCITSVKATMAAGGTTATYDISVGGTSWKSGNLSKKSTEYTATGSGFGEIVITLDQNNGGKAVYLGKISITYEDAPSTDYTLTWNNNGNTETTKCTNGKLTLPDNPNAPEDYAFMGWTVNRLVKADGRGIVYAKNGDGIDRDTEFYAVYAKTSTDSEVALVKMNKGDKFADGDRIVIVAHNTKTAMYQQTVSSSYVNKYTFDGNIMSIVGDDKNWLTVTSNEDGYILGDATNGYIYSSSNNLYCGSTQQTWTLKDLDDGTFKLQSDSRYLSYRSDLSNMYWRMGGASLGTSGKTVLDIYKITKSTVYLDFMTNFANITSAGWATACIPFNATVSDNVTAYYVISITDGVVGMSPASVIPEGQGVLLKSNDEKATIATFASSSEQADNVGVNMLIGSLAGETFKQDGFVYYRLANKDGDVGFYKQNDYGWAECAAGKAVLEVPVTAAPSFFTFDDATAINAISNVKTSSVRYNLNGQAVGEDYKGIVIVNGKKMFNK